MIYTLTAIMLVCVIISLANNWREPDTLLKRTNRHDLIVLVTLSAVVAIVGGVVMALIY